MTARIVLRGTDTKLQVFGKVETGFEVKRASDNFNSTTNVNNEDTQRNQQFRGYTVEGRWYGHRRFDWRKTMKIIKELLKRSRVGALKGTKERQHSLWSKLAVAVIQATRIKLRLRRGGQ